MWIYSKLTKNFLGEKPIVIIIIAIMFILFAFLCFPQINMEDTEKYNVTITNVQRASGHNKAWGTFDTKYGSCYYEFMSGDVVAEYEKLQALDGMTVVISVTNIEGFPFTLLNENMMHVVEIRDQNNMYFSVSELNNTKAVGRTVFITLGIALIIFSVLKIIKSEKKEITRGRRKDRGRIV